MTDVTRRSVTHNQALTDLKQVAGLIREHHTQHPGTEITCLIRVVLPEPAPKPDEPPR